MLRSSSPQTSLKDVDAEDGVDFISRIGCRGRAKGQFSNPQVSYTAYMVYWSNVEPTKFLPEKIILGEILAKTFVQ